jgi:SAM-dependent methyltransferase
VNRFHRWFCGSGGWRLLAARRLVPWALEGVDLGADVLELGPGPGASTAALQALAPSITCLEIDERLAAALRQRDRTGQLHVIHGDATDLPFADHSFDAVVSFSMLHHVASVALQDRAFVEAARVLRPGGVFAGADISPGWLFSAIHVFQQVIAVEPDSLGARLSRAGFDHPFVDRNGHMLRFSARTVAGSGAA